MNYLQNASSFSKSSTLHENIIISRLKWRLRKCCKKENLKRKFKPMIGNFQEKLHQMESKQSVRAKVCANIRWKLKGEERSKTFLKKLKGKIWKIEQLPNFILSYTEDKNKKHSINLEYIPK